MSKAKEGQKTKSQERMENLHKPTGSAGIYKLLPEGFEGDQDDLPS